MNDITAKAAELAVILTKMQRMSQELLECAELKEKALVADKISELREVLDREEDLTDEFWQAEKKRVRIVEDMAKELELDPETASLKQLAARLDSEEARGQLTRVGSELNTVVTELREKNQALTEILKLKNDYADIMLEILTVGKEKTRSYNSDGSVGADQRGAEPGVVEIFV